jgi:hypothetical protein
VWTTGKKFRKNLYNIIMNYLADHFMIVATSTRSIDSGRTEGGGRCSNDACNARKNQKSYVLKVPGITGGYL